MNICHNLLISVCLLLVINIDELIVHSSGIFDIFKILRKGIEEPNENSSNLILDDSHKKYKGGFYYIRKRGVQFPEENGEESSSEETESEHSSTHSRNVNSNEKSEKKNSNEESGSKNSNEESGSQSSSEESGSKNSNEKRGSKNSNKKRGSKNSNKGNEIKNSNKKSKIKNSNEKNKNENSNETNEIGNSYEGNNMKNESKTNEGVYSIDKIEIISSKFWNYLSSIKSFHRAKYLEYPYHIAFVWEPSGRLLCQGTVIQRGWAITSAYCLSRYDSYYSRISVVFGAISLDDEYAVTYSIAKLFYYPGFIPQGGLNDFVLVMLGDEIYKNHVKQWEVISDDTPQPPPKNTCQFSTFVGRTLYGRNVDYVLQEDCDITEMEDQILSYMCASVHGKLIKITHATSLGSPLVCNGVVRGIKSKHTFFTMVDDLKDWVEETINDALVSDET